MLVEIQNKFIQALEESGGFKTVDGWQGDVEELLRNPQKLPSAHVIFGDSEFRAAQTIGSAVAPTDMVWSVILMSKNVRDRKSGAVESYQLIETVLAKLTKLNTGYGFVWPGKVVLISVERGVAAYGFHFIVEQTQ